jgi:hypothetical protein
VNYLSEKFIDLNQQPASFRQSKDFYPFWGNPVNRYILNVRFARQRFQTGTPGHRQHPALRCLSSARAAVQIAISTACRCAGSGAEVKPSAVQTLFQQPENVGNNPVLRLFSLENRPLV